MLGPVLAGLSKKAAAVVLILAMSVAALFLWVGIPIGWLWIGSQLVSSSQPSMGPYAVVAIGIVASVVIDAMILSRLNRTYQRVTDTDGQVRIQLPWLKSMRGEREAPRQTTVLDIILVGSVTLAGLTMLLWWVFLAGSPLPGG
jgi:hypothetical protein